MSQRPFCCPEPRCAPLLNIASRGVDVSVATGGNSFFCWGRMERPVEFTYDGVTHVNDLNFCTLTPLKGLVRMQENEADWGALASGFAVALDMAQEAVA